MKCVVTGSLGFIGKHLVGQLTEMGREVYSLGSRVAGVVESLEVDLTERAAVHQFLRRVEADEVYHLAGAAQVSGETSFEDYFRMNFLTTKVVAEGLVALKRPAQMLLASSLHVYGGEPRTVDERSEVRPETAYAFTKFLAEQAVREAVRQCPGFHSVVARFGNCIGPGQGSGFVVADFCERLARYELGMLDQMSVGALDAKRQFLDVRDVVSILPKLMEHSRGEPFSVYNVAGPRSVTIGELLKLMMEVSGTSPEIRSDAEMAKNSVKCLEANTEKLEKLYPEGLLRPLRQTLTDTYQNTLECMRTAKN